MEGKEKKIRVCQVQNYKPCWLYISGMYPYFGMKN